MPWELHPVQHAGGWGSLNSETQVTFHHNLAFISLQWLLNQYIIFSGLQAFIPVWYGDSLQKDFLATVTEITEGTDGMFLERSV